MLSAFFTGKSKYLLLSDFVIWKFSFSSKQSLRSILVSVEDFDVSFNLIVYDFVPGNDEYYVSQESKYFAPPKREYLLIPFFNNNCISEIHSVPTLKIKVRFFVWFFLNWELKKSLSEEKWGEEANIFLIMDCEALHF